MSLAQINESYLIRQERLSFFPKNFKRELTVVPTASELDTHARFSGASIVKVPVWVFSASGMALKARKPVSVKVFMGENLFFAENETLDIFATGETREEAVRAFNEHLIYFYNHYRKLGWDRVTGEAKRLKRLYEDLFQDVVT